MARFPFLNADGTFQSAQVKTQLDARTDARMRDQIPTLAEELGIGGSGMPDGGQPGQVLTTGADGKAAWQAPAAASAIKVGGTQPTSGWWLDSGNVYVTPTPDTVAPVAGTLTVTTTSSKATLTVSGASDDRALNAAPYSFSKDNGITWGGWQSSPVFEFTGLAQGTTFTFRHRVRDAEGNVTVGTAVVRPTAQQVSAFRDAMLAKAPTAYWPLDETTTVSAALYKNLGSGTQYTLTRMTGTPGAASLGDGTTSMSISAQEINAGRAVLDGCVSWSWQVLVGVDSSSGTILDAGFGSTNAGQVVLNTSTGDFKVYIKGVTVPVTKPSVLTGRHHIVLVVDNTSAYVYWDGQQIGQATVGNTALAQGADPGIRGALTGRASSLAFWRDRALTASEIQSLYAALPAL